MSPVEQGLGAFIESWNLGIGHLSEVGRTVWIMLEHARNGKHFSAEKEQAVHLNSFVMCCHYTCMPCQRLLSIYDLRPLFAI